MADGGRVVQALPPAIPSNKIHHKMRSHNPLIQMQLLNQNFQKLRPKQLRRNIVPRNTALIKVPVPRSGKKRIPAKARVLADRHLVERKTLPAVVDPVENGGRLAGDFNPDAVAPVQPVFAAPERAEVRDVAQETVDVAFADGVYRVDTEEMTG